MQSRPMLIGLHSVKRGGKNTTANFIEKIGRTEFESPLSARQRGFADKAKWAFARQFIPGISMEEAIAWVDQFKDNPTAEIHGLVSESYNMIDGIFPVTPFRQALAQFATDGGRDIYGDDFWVDQLLPAYPSSRNPEGWHGEFMVPPKTDSDWPYSIADLCLVTDERFENELHRIRHHGGVNIKIRRKDAEDAVIAEAKAQGREIHRSELGIPDEEFDWVINNDDNDLSKAFERTREAFYSLRRKFGLEEHAH